MSEIHFNVETIATPILIRNNSGEKTQTQKLGFIGQLDSFRFFAVFLVIISHWIPGLFLNKIPNGYLGVTFFFVLSGFLISSNLFFAKRSVAENKLTTKKALLNFYARRFLRIFPLYYLTLFIIWVLNKGIYEKDFLWYLFYASNILTFVKQHWQESLSHFWSLAVEEQFYLIWPFLILLVPIRFLKSWLIIVISISVLYKVFTIFIEPRRFSDVLTIAAFDSFGLGALLAYQRVYGKGFRIFSLENIKYVFALLVISFVLCVIGKGQLLVFVWPLFSVLLIAKSIPGYTGLAGHVLNNRVFKYFGKISYGIYVYHNFIPWLVRCLMGAETKYPISIKPVLKNWHPAPAMLLTFEFCFLIAIASISWYGFERPINGLKKYF